MGLGAPVPPGPPRVSASMKPRTTVLRRAVPNSSRVYLPDTRRGRGVAPPPDRAPGQPCDFRGQPDGGRVLTQLSQATPFSNDNQKC